MRASVGDRLHVHGRVVGSVDSTAEIIDVRGADGAPPFVVRYPDGHEALVFPGADAVVEPISGEAQSGNAPSGGEGSGGTQPRS